MLHIFDDSTGRQPHLNRVVDFDCPGTTTCERSLLVFVPWVNRNVGGYFDEHETDPFPLWMAATRFTRRGSQWRHRCPSCSGTLGGISLSCRITVRNHRGCFWRGQTGVNKNMIAGVRPVSQRMIQRVATLRRELASGPKGEPRVERLVRTPNSLEGEKKNLPE